MSLIFCKLAGLLGNLYVYNGVAYLVLTEGLFCALCKTKLPEDILEQLTSMRILKDAFQYASLRDPDDRTEKLLAETYRYHVVFENCVVDLKTGKIEGHHEFIAVPGMIHAKYIDDEVSTPAFDALLETMTEGDEDSILLVKQMIAYCMILNLPTVRAFFWLGPNPGSGKSVLIDFIAQLLGPEQVSHVPADDIGGRFGCSQLIERPVNLGPEATGMLSTNCVNMIKTLSGDPVINIERKFMARADFPNRTKQIYASNNPPSLKNVGDTTAFWERMKLIVCTGFVAKDRRDPFFGQKLWAERDAIVTNIAKEVAPALIKSGFNFIEPEKSVKQKEDWAEEQMDSCQKFFKNCIEKADENSYVPAQELFEAYQKYSGDETITEIGFGMKFCKFVPKRNKRKHKVPGYKNQVSCYFCIKLKPESEW